ncbi:hypothetical protein MKW98_029100 [Papaver atlanticum]|uniref:Major facilitator superfamily (MFS) profile domain-containing protein n=1 Tax=Papaver atlanticum TaxID=357466 RepID=A0AAD4SAS0_9MAGN|nr:hypothetical protein MKW98_029100 [Papaver atlanticum]
MYLGIAGAQILIFLTIYISEISPSAIRGALVSTVFLQIAGGQLLYHLLNRISSSTTQEIHTWHWLLATSLPIIHIIVYIAGVLPESPRWLYRNGYKQLAEVSLKLMRRSSCEVFKDVTAMELSLVEEVDEVEERQQENELTSLDDVLTRRIIVGFGSLVTQQLVGISMIMHYNYAIFHLTTNRYNSKIINGNADTVISMVSSVGDENRDFWYNTDEERATCMGLLALLALAMYIIFHLLGIGTVPWIINTEIYPMKYKAVSLAMANIAYWSSKMIVQDLLFDSLGSYLSVAQTLFMLCLISAVVGLFIYFYIPETKRLQLEDVEKALLRQEKCNTMDDYHQKMENSRMFSLLGNYSIMSLVSNSRKIR